MRTATLWLLVFAGTDALQQCMPAPSRAAAVYRRASTQRRPALLKLCADSTSTSDAVAAAASYPAVPAYRECLVFALNAVGIYAAPTLMSLIDAAFVGRVSTTQLAALGPAGSISDSVPFFMLFVSIAATNLVAKAHAAKDQAGTARIARTSVVFGGAAGLLLAAATLLSAASLSRFYCGGNAAVLAPLCARYVGVRALGLPAVLVASVAQAVLVGMKDTKTPMLAVAVAACLNLGGDFVLVSRMGLGLAGAAWATVASQVCAAALLLRVLARRKLLAAPLPPPLTPRRADAVAPAGGGGGGGGGGAAPADTRATIVAICSFASFIFVMSIKVAMHNACAATAASLGGAPAAAHTALMAVAWLCFTFGDVGSSLAQAYLPAFSSSPPAAREGKSQPKPTFDLAAAKPTIAMLLRVTCSISATVVLLSSLIVGVFAGQLTPDKAVQRQMRRVLPLMVATLATHGTAVTLEGLLLARKAFRGLALAYTGVFLSVAAGLLLVRTRSLGLLGVWAVYVWYCAGRVVAFAALGGLLGRGTTRSSTE